MRYDIWTVPRAELGFLRSSELAETERFPVLATGPRERYSIHARIAQTLQPKVRDGSLQRFSIACCKALILRGGAGVLCMLPSVLRHFSLVAGGLVAQYASFLLIGVLLPATLIYNELSR